MVNKQIGGSDFFPSAQDAGARSSFLPGWLTGWLSGSESVGSLTVPRSDQVFTNENVIQSTVSSVPSTYPYPRVGGAKKKTLKKKRRSKKAKKLTRGSRRQ